MHCFGHVLCLFIILWISQIMIVILVFLDSFYFPLGMNKVPSI